MKVNGKTINSMAKAQRLGMKVLSMMENTLMERKKALERWLKAPLQPANERKVLSRKWLELFFTSSKKAQIESS